MSTQRVSGQRGWVNPKALPRGPNDRALCRQCNAEVPVGRRSFCGDQCVDRWKIKTNPTYVRTKLYARDHGVCTICGIDCKALVKKLEKLEDKNGPKNQYTWEYENNILKNVKLMTKLQELKIPVHRYRSRPWYGIWDADHIIPVIEGGGECGLDNYRTLCCQCHKQETAKLAAKRAKSTKNE